MRPGWTACRPWPESRPRRRPGIQSREPPRPASQGDTHAACPEARPVGHHDPRQGRAGLRPLGRSPTPRHGKDPKADLEGPDDRREGPCCCRPAPSARPQWPEAISRPKRPETGPTTPATLAEASAPESPWCRTRRGIGPGRGRPARRAPFSSTAHAAERLTRIEVASSHQRSRSMQAPSFSVMWSRFRMRTRVPSRRQRRNRS